MGKPTGERLKRDRNQAIKAAREFFTDPRAVILDTETTGLGPKAEVIQIAVIDNTGQSLFNSLVNPERKTIPSEASAIHGLTKKKLLGAPDWITVQKQIEPILKRATVYTYNTDYDERLMVQTSQRYSMKVLNLDFVCVMKMYSRFKGIWNDDRDDYKWHKLKGGDHSALGDCLAALSLLKEMAEFPISEEDELQIKQMSSTDVRVRITFKPSGIEAEPINWQKDIIDRNERETKEYLEKTPAPQPVYPLAAMMTIMIFCIFIVILLVVSCTAR